MESIDLFIKLNDESEKYLEENYDNLYTRNLYIYAQKANQLSGCTPLEKIDIEEPYIDLLEGIELVCHYLKGLNPILEKSFMTMFTNGQLEINYTDEDIWLEEKTKGSWCCNKNNKKILEDRKDISIHTVPLSLINIDNKKTSFPLLAKIIHEFFHTLIAKDKNGNRTTVKAVAITEMISIYYEFDFVKKMIEKGYSKNNFLNCYYERYNNTTDKIELDRFLDQTILLYKKQTEGVLDGTSYKTGNVTTSKETFEDLYEKIHIFLRRKKKSHFTQPINLHLI